MGSGVLWRKGLQSVFMVLLVAVNCGDVEDAAKALGCAEAPGEVGDVVNCGSYALYMNHRGDVCYLGVTYPELWRGWQYDVEVAAKRLDDSEARGVLCKLSHIALVAAATAAPSVRPETEATVYHHAEWVWVRKGYTPHGSVASLVVGLLQQIHYTMDFFPLLIDDALKRLNGGEELCGGVLIRLGSSPATR
ncbi:hypothetical protein Pcal_0278 [Pyrobaculum calidifontis JCM 11548]|uniref:Uncharacterized protein n=2 Tax=Pyrobaculum calidifontis TaxID=181486 RepID=A3MSU8_PYRCJ|nr:hypothetical protein Pcal_0278 [Pyrobaculum calidifontis JCM 11548]